MNKLIQICTKCTSFFYAAELKDGKCPRCEGAAEPYRTQSEPSQKMLNRAMSKAVELGIFPESAPQEVYLKNWNNMQKILKAALGN